MTPPTSNRIRSSHEKFRDFDDEVPEPRTLGPSFKMGGEEFHCVGKLAGATLMLLGRIVGTDARGRAVRDPALLEFMEGVIAEELPVMRTPDALAPDDGPGGEAAEVEVWEPCDDLERWRALLEDKARPIEAEKLGEVIGWLIEVYTDRPTRASGR